MAIQQQKDENGNPTGGWEFAFDDGTVVETGAGGQGVKLAQQIWNETKGSAAKMGTSNAYQQAAGAQQEKQETIKAIEESGIQYKDTQGNVASAEDVYNIKKLADVMYLAQTTGVDQNVYKKALSDAGLAPDSNSIDMSKLLGSYGYSVGAGGASFYENSTLGGPEDVGASAHYNAVKTAVENGFIESTEANLEEYSGKINPDTGEEYKFITNDFSANAALVQQAEAASGKKSAANSQSSKVSFTQYEETLNKDYAATEQKVADMYGGTPQLYNSLQWGLSQQEEEAEEEDKGYTVNKPKATITGGATNVPGGGQITGGTSSTYTGPSYVGTPNIGAVTPIYGGEDTGLTETTVPTYEAGIGLQETQFANRVPEQAKFYQPQTQAEKENLEKADPNYKAPAFENVLYRNRFGMTMYIQHINGVPTQPIPPGYYRVQDIVAQGNAKGGMIQSFSNGGLPEGVTIKRYGNRYGYADPFGNQIKFTEPGGGTASTFYDEASALSAAQNVDYVKSALDPYNPYSGDLNPALGYQPGGNIIQSEGGYRIQYPGEGGATSQLFQTYGQAVAANRAGASNLGLPDYETYLSNMGVNPELSGYDPTAYQAAYQSYLSDPATLAAIQQSQQEPVEADVSDGSPDGTTTVTADDLAQYQRNLAAQAYAAPGATVAAAPVSYIDPNAYGTVMESTAGQSIATAPMVEEDQVAQIDTATTADVPQKIGASQVTPQQAYSDVQQATEDMTAAQLTGPTKEIDAATQTGTSLAGMTSATGKSTDVTGAPTRTLDTTVGASELITGTGVDQTKVKEIFGEGELKAASVQDELSSLMQQFEGGDTPAWAAGSMRAAMATLASRGLGASSMAGQAVIQAAMESALPIAQIDASNKQQVALFKAEQRAKFLGMEFDQAFQAKVQNAARISEIANMNFTAEQQVALENSKAANTMGLQNLSNKQALVMAEAAALSQMDMANLNNRQQAAVQNAQNFLQVDMANLNNYQQTALFKQQSLVNSILGDQAAANAAQQFNATSENQTNQFFANLGASVNQFNSAQMNAMKQFNAGEVNSLLEFNANLQSQREMFNAQQYLVVAQANAQWRQNLATINTAAANESNMDYAQTVNGLTLKTLDEIWQRERDLMDYSFTSSENAADRALSILLGDKQLDAVQKQLDSQEDQALGSLLTKVFFSSDWKSIFSSDDDE